MKILKMHRYRIRKYEAIVVTFVICNFYYECLDLKILITNLIRMYITVCV